MSRRKDRLYFRKDRGGWYADLRDKGGKQEAMIPAGSRRATTDRDEANRLLVLRLKALERGNASAHDPHLAEYAKRHLALKANSRRASTIERDELCLRHILASFGDVPLSRITVARLNDYLAARKQEAGSRKWTRIGSQTLLHELHALSSLFRRAVAEGAATENPVVRLSEKPRIERREAVWLELGEGARLLAAAAALDRKPHRTLPYLAPILATFLLTGARRGEVFGLEVEDISREHDVIHICDNRWRKLKRSRHRRHIPLWPQLNDVLTAYQEQFDRTTGLLFPAPRGGMLSDIRAGIRTAVSNAEIEKHVTPHTFRHTYAAARMQTTDHGAPVSPYTVMRELGHSSIALIEKTYGHLSNVRVRSPVVEYREATVVPFGKKKQA